MTLLFHASVPFSKQIQLLPLNLLTSSIYFLLPIQTYHQKYHSKNRWTAAPLSQGKYRIPEYPPLFSLIYNRLLPQAQRKLNPIELISVVFFYNRFVLL